MLRNASLNDEEVPQFVFVRPVHQEVVHIPESPVPLNSPEWLNRSPFKFNQPLPNGETVRDIVFDQERFYSELVRRFKKLNKATAMKSTNVKRNASSLFKLAGHKPLKIATQSFIYNELDQLNSPRLRQDSSFTPGDFGRKSFHPSSPNFVSQHSILDLTHVSRERERVVGEGSCMCLAFYLIQIAFIIQLTNPNYLASYSSN